MAITNTFGKKLIYEILLDQPEEGILLMPEPGSNLPLQPRPQSRVRIRASEEQRELGDE